MEIPIELLGAVKFLIIGIVIALAGIVCALVMIWNELIHIESFLEIIAMILKSEQDDEVKNDDTIS